MDPKTQQDEYSKAFHDSPEAAEADAPAPVAEADSAPQATEAPGNEADGNSPSADAPEGGAADAAAVAVTLNGEGDDDSDVPAEDMQAYRSWRGRLKKREEELAAREAALAGRDAAPVALKDGGEAKGEDWNRLKAQEYMVHDHMVEGPDGETQLSGNGSIVDLEDGDGKRVMTTEGNRDRMWGGEGDALAERINNAPKLQLADGGEVPQQDDDAILATFAEDYGPDFVAAIEKMVDKRARAIVEEMGGAYVSDLSSRIDAVMAQASEGMGRMHGDVLTALREDAEEIASSPEFQQWIDGLDDEAKASAQRVVESGTLREVLGLFKQYDGSKGDQAEKDKWAEDAAAGVKGSAPIKLPTRAPASPDDEYKQAWNQF